MDNANRNHEILGEQQADKTSLPSLGLESEAEILLPLIEKEDARS